MLKLLFANLIIFIALPGQAADLSLKLGRTFAFDGVNCHSASLQAAGVIKYPTHVTDQEIQFLFQTQCHQVPRNQKGAIGITGMGTAFSHSFFYLEPNKIFEKKSLEKKTTYQVRKGGYYTNAKYFVCRSEPNDCGDKRVAKLRTATDNFGKYFAHYLLSADGMKQRDLRNKQLIQLQKMTNSLSGLPHECRRAVRYLQLRQDSLRAVSDRNSGARFFINMIPKSVGRD